MSPKSPKQAVKDQKSPRHYRTSYRPTTASKSAGLATANRAENLPRLTIPKQNIFNSIEQEQNALNDIGHDIWRYCEVAGKELQSSKRIVDYLKHKGFELVELSQDFGTAFRAEFKSHVEKGVEIEEGERASRAPNVGFLCEFYAELSSGHSYGHNLVTVNALAAAIGLQSVIRFSKKQVLTVTVIGCPGNELKSMKKKMLDARCFQGIDFLMTAYPAHFTCLQPSFVASKKVQLTFRGRGPSDGVKEPWEMANPVNAVVLAQQNLSYIRQNFDQNWVINGVIPIAGEDPSKQPEKGCCQYELKAPTQKGLDTISEKLKQCMDGASTASGCRYTECKIGAPQVNNINCNRFAELYRRNATLNGFTFHQEYKELIQGPDDIGYVSRAIPTFKLFYYAGTSVHPGNDEFNRYCGSPEAQYMSIVQGKSLAMMTIDLIKEDDAMNDILESHDAMVNDYEDE